MYKHYTLDSKLTLRQFIELFNDDNENSFWDQFYITYYDIDTKKPVDLTQFEVKLTSRNHIQIGTKTK